MPRRRVLVGILVGFALVDAALALAVVRTGSGSVPVTPLPLHPIAGTFVPDDTQFQECSDELCFQQAFGNIAYRDGPKAAFALIGSVYGDGGGTSCHRVAHEIGAASLARYGGSVERTLAKGSSECGSGYYHGVLERSLVGVKKRTPDTLGRGPGRDRSDLRDRKALRRGRGVPRGRGDGRGSELRQWPARETPLRRCQVRAPC